MTKRPAPELPEGASTEAEKARAETWFRALRDDICAAFEQLEDTLTGTGHGQLAGRFERTPWERQGGGSGEMSVMPVAWATISPASANHSEPASATGMASIGPTISADAA